MSQFIGFTVFSSITIRVSHSTPTVSVHALFTLQTLPQYRHCHAEEAHLLVKPQTKGEKYHIMQYLKANYFLKLFFMVLFHHVA